MISETFLADNILPGVATLVVSCVGYLVKYYFGQIAKNQKELTASINTLSGRLEGLHKDLRDNTVQMAITSTEVKAIWRFIDGAHERATDLNGR